MNANPNMHRPQDSESRISASLVRGCAAAALLLALASPAVAQSGSDSVDIGGTAFHDTEGRVGVNAAAGGQNQQANVAAIANGPTAISGAIVEQHQAGNAVIGSEDPIAVIGGTAFSGASGAIAVNAAAGPQNQQANVLAIATGIEGQALALDLLAQSRASTEPPGDPDSPTDTETAVIGPQAFTDASGLVQVNLSAGERNSSANLFALTLPGGAD